MIISMLVLPERVSKRNRFFMTRGDVNIWIDGDACPKPIKQILFRAATKRQVALWIVANHIVTVPPSPFIKKVLVEAGFDAADRYIVQHVEPHDLVITSDIILADLVVAKKAIALNPKGVLYSEKNIKQVLTIRNMNESLRSSGLIVHGPGQLNAKEIQLFSNHLDRVMTRCHQK